jgi:hypothetical protein
MQKFMELELSLELDTKLLLPWALGWDLPSSMAGS